VRELRDELGLIADVPVVGFVGRLTEDKGLRVLADARRVLEEGRVDYQLLIVGGVDDSNGPSHLMALSAHGRKPVITGHVGDPSIYYKLMDVFCLPTYREGFPNVVLEAGASSLPTVTTTATGAIDSVIDGSTGLVVEIGDSNATARALKELIEDKTLREHMGNNAVEYVSAEYSRNHVWALLADFYSTGENS
jgi:glycosyltransferase involved in cell wall biosynthesis